MCERDAHSIGAVTGTLRLGRRHGRRSWPCLRRRCRHTLHCRRGGRRHARCCLRPHRRCRRRFVHAYWYSFRSVTFHSCHHNAFRSCHHHARCPRRRRAAISAARTARDNASCGDGGAITA